MPFVSRGGIKLEHALTHFGVAVEGLVCADLGCSTGGFTDCLLQRGAARIYAVDTGYGVLDYRLRRDGRVVVLERTNAMHVQLPEPVDLVTIDAGWTRQRHILPRATLLLRRAGEGRRPGVISLLKPHYEAERRDLQAGILPEEKIEPILEQVRADIAAAGFEIAGVTPSPIKGQKGNTELLALLHRYPPAG